MPIYPQAAIEDLDGDVLVRNLVVSVQSTDGKVHATFLLNPGNSQKIGLARRYRLVVEEGRSADFTVTRVSADKDGSTSVTAELFSGKLG